MARNNKSILSISDLSICVQNKLIIANIFLEFNLGKTYALLGPNGSGKSSLAHTIIGDPKYTITQGTITYKDTDLNLLSISQRAQAGIFLAFQHPQSVPGVRVHTFLYAAYNAIRKDNYSLELFNKKIHSIFDYVGLDNKFINRNLNDNFSGGEKKKLELAQAILLQPKLIIFDELDAGLDQETLKIYINTISHIRTAEKDSTLIIISHNSDLISQIAPDIIYTIEPKI